VVLVYRSRESEVANGVVLDRGFAPTRATRPVNGLGGTYIPSERRVLHHLREGSNTHFLASMRCSVTTIWKRRANLHLISPSLTLMAGSTLTMIGRGVARKREWARSVVNAFFFPSRDLTWFSKVHKLSEVDQDSCVEGGNRTGGPRRSSVNENHLRPNPLFLARWEDL
jgi:hypothetical protein